MEIVVVKVYQLRIEQGILNAFMAMQLYGV